MEFEHYKGGRYRLLHYGKMEYSLLPVVIYQRIGGEQDIWVRPYSEFHGNVVVNGETVPRFKRVN